MEETLSNTLRKTEVSVTLTLRTTHSRHFTAASFTWEVGMVF